MTEIEAVLNTRPLTYVESDVNGEVIAPADFISHNTKSGLIMTVNNNDDTYLKYITNLSSPEKLLLLWKKGTKHLDHFWKLWKNDYLLNLRERTKCYVKQPNRLANRQPMVGDVMQVSRNVPQQGTWSVGIIIELIICADGEIRAAKERFPSGAVSTRSLTHLYPLESSCITNQTADYTTQSLSSNAEVSSVSVRVRPPRTVATRARKWHSHVSKDLLQ